MNGTSTSIINSDEKEILEELMNIAFGSASAELGEIVDIRISLNVPEIHILSGKSVPAFLQQAIDKDSEPKIVEQNFWGDFSGKSFLVISIGNDNDVIELSDETLKEDEGPPYAEMRHEGVLLEIGNILVGACIGKISELLSTVVTYSPPSIRTQNREFSSLLAGFDEPVLDAILLKTIFSFDEKDINGFLLIITTPDSIAWLKTALNNFMERYE